MVAILPAAGKGTRMKSVASGSKELLPVAGKPVLAHVLDEALAAGVDDCMVVLSPNKPDLKAFVESHGRVSSVVQESADGLAPAMLRANRFEPTLLLLPDTIFWPSSPSGRLVKALSRGYDFAIAVEPISEERVSSYGIVEWNPDTGRISRILEKPKATETSSRWAIAARFAISERTISFISDLIGGNKSDQEIQLTPLLDAAIHSGYVG